MSCCGKCWPSAPKSAFKHQKNLRRHWSPSRAVPQRQRSVAAWAVSLTGQNGAADEYSEAWQLEWVWLVLLVGILPVIFLPLSITCPLAAVRVSQRKLPSENGNGRKKNHGRSCKWRSATI